jgi:hypothetical protein
MFYLVNTERPSFEKLNALVFSPRTGTASPAGAIGADAASLSGVDQAGGAFAINFLPLICAAQSKIGKIAMCCSYR